MPITLQDEGLSAATKQELDQLVANLQRSIGSIGRWVTVTDAADWWRCEGSGNSWTPVSASSGSRSWRLRYLMLGPTTMLLNIYVNGSNLVATATATNVVKVKIPGDFKVAGDAAIGFAPGFFSHGTMINAGTNYTAQFAASAQTDYIQINRLDASNLANDAAGGFQVLGQITFEVTPRR